ncbi:MAG: hypothetical protein KQH63_16275 [Desulfobulbaceae bacterium]|nr:hypothetical protein [Desulfobulbaceae bacterium]
MTDLIGRKYNLLAEWILEGKNNSERLKKREGNQENLVIISKINEWVENITSKDERKLIWFEAQFEEKFPEFKAWKEKKDSEESRDNSHQQEKIA